MNNTSTNCDSRWKTASRKWVLIGICVLLAAMVWTVFGQTLGQDFVNIDDNDNVYDNPAVTNGLTLHGIAWAFTHTQVGHWDPLTTISHMLDCTIYGLNPWGHHLTNVLLHTASVILLFLTVRQMTGTLWRSFFVAALFAIHPLRAESVAWVSERKDVLSAVFFMLTMAAYVRYTRKPQSLPRYMTALSLFALGLLAKSMLVTLPFVLLLLDYWPLGRFAQTVQPKRLSIPSRLILEKAPFLMLSGVACAIQILSDQELIVPANKLPIFTCIANALVSYVTYFGEMIYPAGLEVYYPHPETHIPIWKVISAILLLAFISACVVSSRRNRPYLVVGWLWYLGMLVPVIGLVQSGAQAHADRYTYLPQIGLYIAIAWMTVDLFAPKHPNRTILGTTGMITIAVLMVCAWIQTSYWKNSESLWNHALAVTPENSNAHYLLGEALVSNGRVDEGVSHYRRALDINPEFPEAHSNLGLVLMQRGQVSEAVAEFQRALDIKPDYAEVHYNLGLALKQEGDVTGAIAQFQKAVTLKPDYAEAHYDLGLAFQETGQPAQAIDQYNKALDISPGMLDAHLNLGNILAQGGDVKGAIAQFQKVLELKPDYAKAHYNLGFVFQQSGRIEEAIAQYNDVLEVQPGYVPALNSLAYILATCPRLPLRNGPKALDLALQADKATGDRNPMVLQTLAAAYAETGHYSDAVDTAQRALDLAGSQPDPALADQLRSQIALYKTDAPFRDNSLGQ